MTCRGRKNSADNVGPRCDDGCSCCALALRRDKTSQRARCTSRLDVFFSFRRARNALTNKHNHMHITMHANLQKMLHMVPHGTKHLASSGNGALGGLGGMEAELAMGCKTTSPALLAL